MDTIARLLRRLRGERGITGLETAIILIAFVVVAAVFAFVVLSTGLFSSERSKETVYAGLAKTRGSMELTGGIVATSDGTEVTNLAFDVTLAAGGDAVNWTPAATTNRTIVAYVDSSVQVDNLTYTTTVITGDADTLLEAGEMFEINLTGIGAVAGIDINANDKFTIEVQPPSGSYMVIERTMPASVVETTINLN
jgi:flagellin FlaB